MKYISEITGKVYDTAEECAQAEKALAEEKKTRTQHKRELCAKIEEAENVLTKAIEDDKAVREEVRKEFEALKARLQKSKDALVEAETKRYEAVSNFAKEFGHYKKRPITDEDARKEYDNAVRFWQDTIDALFGVDFPVFF